MAEFQGADSDEERFAVMKEVRGCESVTDEFRAILRELVKRGGAIVWEFTTLKNTSWDEEFGGWKLGLGVGGFDGTKENEEQSLEVDGAVSATGLPVDFDKSRATA
jgi:hypothetical protein